MKKHPIIHVYKHKTDLLELKSCFYDFETKDNRFRGVQKVKALLSRGKLPHTIEITSLLTSIVLLDEKNDADTNILKLSYSMAIIRFVNGLLDNFQQSNYAIPLYQLAKSLNLPSFFVELRHMSTHEALPELPICRIACKRALNWLYDNYWSCLDEDEEDEDEDEDDEQKLTDDQKLQIDDLQTKISPIASDLKNYKKIRKSNLNLIYKYGDDSSIGRLYWKYMKNLKKNPSEIILNVLIYHNFLIYNQESKTPNKFNEKLWAIYKPLLDEFGQSFKIELFNRIVAGITNFYTHNYNIIDRKLNWKITHQFEIIQLVNWLQFLIVDVLNDSTSRNQLLENLVDQLKSVLDLIPPNQYQTFDELIKLLDNLLSSINSKNLKNKISGKTRTLIETWLTSLKASVLIKKSFDVPSLDELLGEPEAPQESIEEPAAKRLKVVKTYLFEEIPNWKPTPFGQSI